MEPLLTAFVAAALGGWGDKTQLVAILLAARWRRTTPIVAALLLATLVNSLAAAFAGTMLRLEIGMRAAALLLAIALAFAGVAALIGEAPKEPRARGGAFVAAFIALLLAGWGDRTQYVAGALAAQYDSLVLVAVGAWAGTLVAALPAALGGEAFGRAVPLKALRIAFACLLLLAAAFVAVNALRLV